MREILFRGKCTDTGEWVEGLLLTVELDTYSEVEKKKYTHCIVEPKTEMYRGQIGYFDFVNPKTVGQYTGLTDRHGIGIFEGDIVKFGKNVYSIVYAAGSFALYDEQGEMISKIGGNNDDCYSMMDLYVECCWEDLCAYDIEVIGNIHDNPDLLP